MNAINAHFEPGDASILDAETVESAIAAACRSIAPTWPLDRFIAVNPYWGLVDRAFAQVDGELSQLAGSSVFMPREFYRQALAQGHFSERHIARALIELGVDAMPAQMVAQLEAISPPRRPLPLLSDCVDARRDLQHEPAWSDTITHQLSQFCAAYFDDAQADWQPAARTGLYAAWREGLIRDHSVAPLMHAPQIAQRAQQLAPTARAAIAAALQHLEIPRFNLEKMLRAVLLRINGWAAWCAYRRWQAQLAGRDDEHIVDLLAMRLAWECLLDDGERDERSVWMRWQRVWLAPLDEVAAETEIVIAQRALEIAFQDALLTALAKPPRGERTRAIAVQAVFCIDVRSEVFRRALEQVAPTISTHGFAGFFGVPISYTPIGTALTRPQLPGLLAPSLPVTETSGDCARDAALQRARARRLAATAARLPFQRQPASAFSLVETLGLGYAVKLVRRSLPSLARAAGATSAGVSRRAAQCLHPRLQLPREAISQRAELAEKIWRAMSFGNDIARLVLLVGHGSQSANNPHAAGLDCGACGGQTGEINARAVAALFNEAAVREALLARGIAIPAQTHFLAALHNTTTDEVELFDSEQVPAIHADDLAQLRRALHAAGARARAERAPQLGLAQEQNAQTLARVLKARANDWAQTRPEWGLANNAAFIAAPRSRSQQVNLHGRAFLHDYDWRRDRDGSVLEAIMTAPMIVAHWINMQYHASTVDNRRYGSGNKLLHNVVGAHIGVFEGNGGDLRIGLSLQSLYDGQRWMHTPLRLSAVIEAPRAMIERVVARHARVRELLDNHWLYVFRIDSQTHAAEFYHRGEWRPWCAAAAAERGNC